MIPTYSFHRPFPDHSAWKGGFQPEDRGTNMVHKWGQNKDRYWSRGVWLEKDEES